MKPCKYNSRHRCESYTNCIHFQRTASSLSVIDTTLQGIRYIRFRNLWHFCASLMLANGIPMKQIQEWLGHSDFSTMANIYAHLDYSSQLSFADAMLSGLGLVEA